MFRYVQDNHKVVLSQPEHKDSSKKVGFRTNKSYGSYGKHGNLWGTPVLLAGGKCIDYRFERHTGLALEVFERNAV